MDQSDESVRFNCKPALYGVMAWHAFHTDLDKATDCPDHSPDPIFRLSLTPIVYDCNCGHFWSLLNFSFCKTRKYVNEPMLQNGVMDPDSTGSLHPFRIRNGQNDPDILKMLDPVPYPDKDSINPDPQRCCITVLKTKWCRSVDVVLLIVTFTMTVFLSKQGPVPYRTGLSLQNASTVCGDICCVQVGYGVRTLQYCQ